MLPPVEVRRSARRSRTVSAYRDGNRIVVLVPARLPAADTERVVSDMVATVIRREHRDRTRGPRRGDDELTRRCAELAARYLPGARLPVSVRWVTSMRHRWASCTPLDASIRVSARLREVPAWVLDYVLVHELVHLEVPGHGPDFWALVARYPRTERARGYLDGVSAASALGFAADVDGAEPADVARDGSDEVKNQNGGPDPVPPLALSW